MAVCEGALFVQCVPNLGAACSVGQSWKSRNSKGVTAACLRPAESIRLHRPRERHGEYGGKIGVPSIRHVAGRSSSTTRELTVTSLLSQGPQTCSIITAGDEDLNVGISDLGQNNRLITARLRVSAPLEAVWSCLSDYANLSDFIPSLATNIILRGPENGRVRLEQVGEQSVAMGFKFRANVIVDCVEVWDAPRTNGMEAREIGFTMVKGDFEEFRGSWRMERTPANGCVIIYSVTVSPMRWLPVKFIENRIVNDVKTNLVAVAGEACKRFMSGKVVVA